MLVTTDNRAVAGQATQSASRSLPGAVYRALRSDNVGRSYEQDSRPLSCSSSEYPSNETEQ